MCLLANIHRDQKKRPHPYDLQDFLPWEKRKASKQGWEEQLKMLQAYGKSMQRRNKRN